jgi:apolipoprotein D and lipocalin family protein
VHRLRLLVLLALGACVSPAPAPQGSFRAASAPIWSSAQLDPARLTGEWRQIAGFGAPAGCRPGGVTISGSGALTAAFRLCASGREWKGGGRMTATGAGRFDLAGQPWWVLWADADYRTLVIGTPDGSFGFVLDRSARAAPDRLRAAREILDWNGYDTTRLAVF